MLYAPLIETSVPAFSDKENFKVYFRHNPGVPSSITSMSLLLKYFNNNKLVNSSSITTEQVSINDGEAIFDISGLSLAEGTYYKVQIAYIDGNTVGQYSSIGITKYLGDKTPIIKVNGLIENSDGTYVARQEYKGQFEDNQSSEILYQYKFSLKDTQKGTIIQESDWLFPEDGQMIFSVNKQMLPGDIYTLIFSTITQNGYLSKIEYNIIGTAYLTNTFTGEIIAFQDGPAFDNGYVKIQIKSFDESLEETAIFRLLRREKNSNFWDIMTELTGSDINTNEYFWLDRSIEQGKVYIYGLCQYGLNEDGLVTYSDVIETSAVAAEFEHIFIGDGEKQLCLAFNPKVSAFKETILETKTDSIGGKYPFVFRNGNVRYKEISISGLLSYWLDSDYFFTNEAELGFDEQMTQFRETTAAAHNGINQSPTTQLIGYNFTAERTFKLKVLEWLNNGQPKLFRSPAEGNYIIRLMNTSLSPNEQLGRIIHTFSSTGYEIMECNQNNLVNNKLIPYHKLNEDINLESDFQSWIFNGHYETFTTNEAGVWPKEGSNFVVHYLYSIQSTSGEAVSIKINGNEISQSFWAFKDLENITSFELLNNSSEVKITAYISYDEDSLGGYILNYSGSTLGGDN